MIFVCVWLISLNRKISRSSMLLQMALFHFFQWLSNIPLYICTTSSWEMWVLDHKESWAPKNWCFWIVVLEKTLESPLDSKEIKLVNSKGNQPWIFIGKTDTEAEVPILWPPDAKTELLEKTLMLWKINGRRKGEKQRMGWFGGIPDSMDMNLSKLQELSVDRDTCSPSWKKEGNGKKKKKKENSKLWLIKW